MKKPSKTTIEVKGTEVTILRTDDGDFISLTDMLKAKDGDFFIFDWLRNRNTVEFLGIWERFTIPFLFRRFCHNLTTARAMMAWS